MKIDGFCLKRRKTGIRKEKAQEPLLSMFYPALLLLSVPVPELQFPPKCVDGLVGCFSESRLGKTSPSFSLFKVCAHEQ